MVTKVLWVLQIFFCFSFSILIFLCVQYFLRTHLSELTPVEEFLYFVQKLHSSFFGLWNARLKSFLKILLYILCESGSHFSALQNLPYRLYIFCKFRFESRYFLLYFFLHSVTLQLETTLCAALLYQLLLWVSCQKDVCPSHQVLPDLADNSKLIYCSILFNNQFSVIAHQSQ